MLFGWRPNRTKIRGDQKEVMRLWIDIHGLGAILSIDGFDFRELIRRVFMKNVKLARAGGDKQKPAVRVEDICVHPGTDGQRLEDLATVRVNQVQEHWVAAARKQPPVLTIHLPR